MIFLTAPLALDRAGNSRLISNEIMEMTTNTSMSVNAEEIFIGATRF
jgi:hypothetical protein